MNVVPDQSAAEQKRVRRNIGAARLLNSQSRNIEGLVMLALDHVVGDDRILAGNKLCRAVAENLALAERNVFFDDGGLGLVGEHKQVARMGHGRAIAAS